MGDEGDGIEGELDEIKAGSVVPRNLRGGRKGDARPEERDWDWDWDWEDQRGVGGAPGERYGGVTSDSVGAGQREYQLGSNQVYLIQLIQLSHH